MKTNEQCIEPGCTRPSIVGINGKWVCLAHMDKHLAALTSGLDRVRCEARTGRIA